MISTHLELCPICEEGYLRYSTRPVQVEFGGATGEVTDHFSVCDCCEIEQAGAAELRLNKRAMIAFRKQASGLLTGADVRHLRSTWKLSQKDAAKVFGGGPVAFSKYESDDVTQSESMDLLLRVSKAVPEAFDWLLRNAAVSPAGTSLTLSRNAVALDRVKAWGNWSAPLGETVHMSTRFDSSQPAANDSLTSSFTVYALGA